MSSISSARRASQTTMEFRTGSAAPLWHGGDLDAARRLFPAAPQPFIDLSTGINPFSYPVPRLAAETFTRLPEPAAIDRLAAIAAQAFGAPSAGHVVAAPGGPILLPFVAGRAPPRPPGGLGPALAGAAPGHRPAGAPAPETSD